ncbi:MAG TPA: LysM peptidoglycan-binding domain-containing protein [Candidatus Fimivivens faecavium]|nr:LysM peptidoglycan-binding domain-containing protein [Candidatus Fimivivens faecavium]
MPYYLFLDEVQVPIPPSSLQMKVKNKNETATLINEGEVNFLKTAGLTELSFDLLLPKNRLPFASYPDGFREPRSYLDLLNRLKTQNLPFRFLLNRTDPAGMPIFATNMRVSLEDYTIQEDADNGMDVVVSVKLRQYRDFGTKFVEYVINEKGEPEGNATRDREADSAPKPETRTVKKGDTLWLIAQAAMGDGNRYPELYEANKAVIDGKNRGTGNPRYTIYPGQVLTIPG